MLAPGQNRRVLFDEHVSDRVFVTSRNNCISVALEVKPMERQALLQFFL